MHLFLLLAVGAIGAAASAWGLARGGRAARIGATTGAIALLVLIALTLAMDAPALSAIGGDGSAGAIAGGLFDGRLVPTAYLRLTLGLWGMDAAVLTFLAWLLGGMALLRGVLPASLAAMTGGAIVLASADLAVGAAAATATGLAALLTVPPSRGRSAVAASAREVRLTLAVGAVLLAVVAVAPLIAALTLGAARAASGTVDGDAAAATTAGASAMLGLAALAVTLGVGARLGAVPFHFRFSRLADAASPIDLPLLLAWLAVPVGVAGLAIVDSQIAPLALPLEGDRAVVIAVALLTMTGAALAAFVQDDLRHAAGYLLIADGGFVLLGFAALDPAAWGPARVWLVAMAASKTALFAWAAVAEDRFGTRSVPDLRGWLRRSPILGAGLILTMVATYGIPGWVAFEARGTLARLAVDAPWDALFVLAGFLTLPTYLRLLALGAGAPTSKVDAAAPERLVRRRGEGVSLLKETLDVEMEGPPPSAPDGPVGDATTDIVTGDDQPGRGLPDRSRSRRRVTAVVTGWGHGGSRGAGRLRGALRRDRTELLAAAVLALAILAALTSWGALDIAGAAAEPAPIAVGPAGD